MFPVQWTIREKFWINNNDFYAVETEFNGTILENLFDAVENYSFKKSSDHFSGSSNRLYLKTGECLFTYK